MRWYANIMMILVSEKVLFQQVDILFHNKFSDIFVNGCFNSYKINSRY